MTNPKVKFKRSSVANKRPTLDNLELGELALNTYDGKLFTKQDTGGVGIATTVTLVNPWNERYGGGGITYTGDIEVTNNVVVSGIVTATSFVGNATGLSGSPSITVTDITASGNVSISGTLTYEDVSNVDSVGLVTARTGVRVTTGGLEVSAGGAAITGLTTVTGNISVSGTVDGRDVATDGTKLDGIESGATADQTAAEIRTLVESATDSNVFTDADHTKLNGIESGATADQTASEILTAIKTVDGSGSGLDADTVDGQQGSYYLNYNNFTNTPTIPTNNNQLTNGAGYITSADGGNAATLDSLDSTQFLRSDADDTFTRLTGTRISLGYNHGSDNSIGCSNWFRSSGSTGWYNGTYGGGWYMSDSTWIRSYNNKSIYHNTGTLRTDGTLQVGSSGSTLNAPNGGTVTINGNTAWHAGNDGSGSGLDADTLDGKDHTNFGATLATYGTTSGSSGRIRCTAPFNTNSAHMFQIKILLYASYVVHEYVVGGYMYSTTNQWYSPTCIYKGNGTPDIIVGRDSNGKAYISIANGNYAGVKVCDMTRGYQTSLDDTYDPWTITIDAGTENSVTPTVSKVWHSTNDGSGSGLDADTLDGYHGSNYIGLNGNSYFQLTNWLQSTSTHGFYSPNSGAGTHFYPGSLGDFGGFRMDGKKGGYGGLSLEGRVVFMHDGSTATGIYNDVNNHWMFYGILGGSTYMYHNGTWKIQTTSSGIQVSGDVNSTSDIKLKKNIETIDSALDKVLRLRGVYFDWKEEEEMGTDRNIGLIAQEVEKVVPELVTEIEREIKEGTDANAKVIDVETIKNISYGNITALLIEAMKEQQQQIEELRKEIKELKGES